MNTEVIYAIGAVTVSILGALRFSRCTRIKCGCIEIERDAKPQEGEDRVVTGLGAQYPQPEPVLQPAKAKPEA